MKDLLFLNPEVQPGLNLTIRDGLKWKDTIPGTELQIKRTGEEEVITEAEVLWTCYTFFDSIPESWLKFEHDLSCRDKEGLRKAMVAAYGEKYREGNNPRVTCLFFHPRESEFVEEEFSDFQLEEPEVEE